MSIAQELTNAICESTDSETMRNASQLAKMLKKAGTSAEDAQDRIQKKYGLSAQELKSILWKTWAYRAE